MLRMPLTLLPQHRRPKNDIDFWKFSEKSQISGVSQLKAQKERLPLFRSRRSFGIIQFLLHQPDQQLVHVLCRLAAGQQFVPEGQHRRCQQSALIGTEHHDPVSFSSPEHGRASTVDQLREDDLLRAAADTVHPSDPFHLIRSLQLLGDAFGLLH